MCLYYVFEMSYRSLGKVEKDEAARKLCFMRDKDYTCQPFSSKLLPSFRVMYMLKAGVHLSRLPTVHDIFSSTFHLMFSKYFD